MSHVTDLMENSPPGEMPSFMDFRDACEEDIQDGRQANWLAASFWGRVCLWLDGRRPGRYRDRGWLQ